MASKLDLRPEIKTENNKHTSAEERFQNETLRGILKLQNNLILALFSTYISESKNSFHNLSKENRELFIESSIQKNMALKNKLLGMTIGMFTSEEFDVYSHDSRGFNKRIISMIITRIMSQINLLTQ
ncbi:MAG: glyoxalase [Flavobacteriales bacterium]